MRFNSNPTGREPGRVRGLAVIRANRAPAGLPTGKVAARDSAGIEGAGDPASTGFEEDSGGVDADTAPPLILSATSIDARSGTSAMWSCSGELRNSPVDARGYPLARALLSDDTVYTDHVVRFTDNGYMKASPPT
jgi:hypothetical protein